MNGVAAAGYVGVFVGSALLALVLTPLALRVALRTGMFDHPGGYKAQTSPVPYLGGAAIVLAFAAVVLVAALIRPPVAGFDQLAALLGLAVALSLVGLADDLWGLSVWLRVAAQVAAGAALWWSGTQTLLVDGGPVDFVLTVIWVVGVTNAFNLLDNMDGLSAGVAAIAAAWFFVIAAVNGQFLVAVLAVALTGCALGFLRHNFHPARIYMGDAGSLFLGFMLAAIGVRLTFPGQVPATAFVPIFVLGVALLDTTLVTFTRLRHRRNVFAGGRDHISHRLVFVGIPVPAAVGLIYVAAIALGWLGLVMARLDPVTAWLLAGLVAAVGAVLTALLAAVPVYETSSRRRVMLQAVEPYVEPGGGVRGPRVERGASTVEADAGDEASDDQRRAPRAG